MAQNKNSDNIRFYGGDDSTVYSAPVGTPFPNLLSEPALAFVDYGLLGEDGIEMEQESDTKEVKVHQGGRVARTKILGTKHSFKFVCTETTARSLGLMYPAAVFTTTNGVTTITDVEKGKRDEKAWIVDEFDEGIHKRVLYTRAEVTERGTIAHKAGEETLYEFTVTSYGAIVIVTNDPGVTGEALTTQPPAGGGTQPPAGSGAATGVAMISGGGVTDVMITNAGSGYNPTFSTVTFVGGDGTGAAGQLILNGTGGVASVDITDPGSGYTTAPNVVFAY